jgi:integrase/recombinase XerD
MNIKIASGRYKVNENTYRVIFLRRRRGVSKMFNGTAHSEKECHKLYAEKLLEAERWKNGESGDITLEEAFQSYHKDKIIAMKLAKISNDEMRNVIRLYDYFGKDFKLKYLTQDKLNGFIEKRQKDLSSMTGKPIKNATVQTAEIYLKAACRFAVENGKLQKIPITNWRKIKRDKAGIRKPMTLNEIERLKKALPFDKDFQNFVELLLTYGSRRDEIGYLKVEDVHFDKQSFTVQTTKNHSIIEQPMIPEVIEIFERQTMGKEKDLYLFASKTNLKVPRNFRNALIKARERAGIPDACFHRIRHTFATEFLKNGGSMAQLAKLLGHSSVSITYSLYADYSRESREEAIAGLRRARG